MEHEMSEEAKVYTCSVCGKPTPNYHEWSPSVAAILGEQGSSTCDECCRKAQISYTDLFRATAWRTVPDLVSGPNE